MIWVEGPSDRIYLKWWLNQMDPTLVEGIHFSIMFYGGRLAAHLSNADSDVEVGDFISLRRLNQRGVIVIDSDRNKVSDGLNDTKLRLQEEFERGPGHAWITDGREIENYVDDQHIAAALAATCPKATRTSTVGKFTKPLRVRGERGAETQAPKVEIARYVVEHYDPNLDRYELRGRLTKLMQFIRDSNPPTIE